jgi:hypothetical protein
VTPWPYGDEGLVLFSAVLLMGDGVLFVEGLVGAPFDGIAIEGPVPASVLSDGLRVQENMSDPGIFQPLLQPVWVPAMTAKTIPKRIQFGKRLRMAINPLVAAGCAI